MSHRFRACTISALILTASFLPQSAPAQTMPAKVAVLRSTGAHGQLSPERVALALQVAADQLKLSGELPRVVIVLSCKSAADVAEIPRPRAGGPDGAIQVESKNGHKIYYLWLLSEPTDELLAAGVVEVLSTDAGRSTESTPATVARVAATLRAQVSRTELQRGE